MKRRMQAGFSVVELMVALTVGLILTAGLLQIFTGNRQTFRIAEASARAQESARLAVELLQREIRNADSWGCYGGARASSGIKLENNLDLDKLPASARADYDFAAMVGTGLEGGSTDLGAGVLGFPDFLRVAGTEGGGGVRVTALPSLGAGGGGSSSATIDVTSTSNIAVGDILIVTDCNDAFVIQATQIPNSTRVNHGTGSTGGSSPVVPGNLSKALFFNSDAEDLRLLKIYRRTLSITEDANGIRSLSMQNLGEAPVPLVAGVQDLQLQFGVDDDSDGTVDRWIEPTDGNDADATIAVRVSVLGRSFEDDVVRTAQQLCYPGWNVCTDEDDFITAPSRHYYSVSTATISLRNRSATVRGGEA